MEMEKELPNSQQMYLREGEDFFKPQQGKERFGFSRLEVWLPRLFMGLYIVYIIGLMIAVFWG